MQAQITALVLGEHGLGDAELLCELDLGDVARLADGCETATGLGGEGVVVDGTPSGPSDRAIALLESGGGPLSSGERVMLLAAWGRVER